MFDPISSRSHTLKGNAGYDNARDNIDPHIITKVLDSKFVRSDGKYVDRTNNVNVSTIIVENTTIETLLWTGKIPANSLSVGNLFKFSAMGKVSNVLPGDEITIRVKVHGITKVTLTNSGRTFSDDDFHIDAVATQRTLGISGSRAMHVDLTLGTDSSSIHAVGTINTTVNMDITITAQWNVAKTGNTLSLYQAFMEYKN